MNVEVRDVQARPIAWTAAILIAVVAAVCAALYWIFPVRTSGEAPHPSLWREQASLGPQLQLNPAQEAAASLRKQRTLLHSYGWSDEQAGVAHIPIEDAMRLLPQRRPELVFERANEQGSSR